MDTMTTIEVVERTASGAYKITLLGDVVAGTKDDEIGALAERLAKEDEANPVAVKLEKLPGGKLLIKSMQEIVPPEELGGSAEPAPVVGEDPTPESADDPPPAVTESTATHVDPDPVISEAEVHARAAEGIAAYIRGLDR